MFYSRFRTGRKKKIRAAMNLLTDANITASAPRRLVPKTALGKWLWAIGCILVLVPLVMVGLLLTVAAIGAVLVLGLISVFIIAIRKIGRRPDTEANRPSLSQRWMASDGRRNVRVVPRSNTES
ncbi:MAG: hypothetical protein ACP5QA_07485 [Phycisphaerae bacterium]